LEFQGLVAINTKLRESGKVEFLLLILHIFFPQSSFMTLVKTVMRWLLWIQIIVKKWKTLSNTKLINQYQCFLC